MLDPRAGSVTLQSHIPSRFKVVSCYLDSGDAAFIGHGPHGLVECGIEVKHLGDLLQSMEDGRLPAGQIMRMREQYDYLFLLLHDRIRSDMRGHLQVWLPKERRSTEHKYDAPQYDRGRWVDAIYGRKQRLMWSDFWKWITSLSVCGGVRLLCAGSNQEAGEMIGACYEWFSKPWSEHKTFAVFDQSHAPTLLRPSITMEVAHALVGGVGWEKAMAAAEQFKTPRKLINAKVSEWVKVSGIGKVLAERAVKAADTVHARREVRRNGKP